MSPDTLVCVSVITALKRYNIRWQHGRQKLPNQRSIDATVDCRVNSNDYCGLVVLQ